MKELTPREIMRELDRYIIGQDEAKRAVAVALRNRYRRAQLAEEIRNEINPKNILMIGPTGVGAWLRARICEKPAVANSGFDKNRQICFQRGKRSGHDSATV